jgi:hypothetical protein
MTPPRLAALLALYVAASPAAALAQVPGTMTVPAPAGTTQCDPGSMLPGTVAGRLAGAVADAERARLVIVPASAAAEFYFGALAQVTHGATPSARLPFNPNDPSSAARYETQLREMQQQMRIVPVPGSGTFRCGGFAPGRYLVVLQLIRAGRQVFYKSYATIPNPRFPGQRFTVSPTQPQPLAQ